MAPTTSTKLYGINSLAVIVCLISSQLSISSGYIASALGTGAVHVKHNIESSGASQGHRKEPEHVSSLHPLSTEERNEGELDTGNPTYTPYVSARVLSNIPKFFEHLRENLEALQNDDSTEEESGHLYGGGGEALPGYAEFEDANRDNNEKLLSSIHWQPAAAMGLNSRMSNIRSFVRQPSLQENYFRRANNYNPSWLYTNLGLGKRRR